MPATIDLSGEVVRPGDSEYEAARVCFNRLYPHYPAAIVFCAGAEDVVNAVKWARQEDIALRARSGGHGLEGWSSVDGGLVIDVSRMKGVEIDTASRTATVQTGLTQKEAVETLGQRGFLIPTGSEGSVGLGGVVPGGGLGLLTRSLGLACDHLLAAEIVVADGPDSAKVIEVDEERHPDLLWAWRGGGGGNFGIATSYTVQLHELPEVEMLIATWAGHGDLGELFSTWQRDAPVADERVGSVLEVNPETVELTALMLGGSRDELSRELEGLLAIGDPKLDFVEGAWPTVFDSADRAPDLPNWKFYSQFVKRPFPDEAIDVIGRYAATAPSEVSNFFCSSFGGAVRRDPPGGSAFPHRDALFYCEPGAGWAEPELNAKALGWVADFARELSPYVDGAYVNVPNVAASDWEREYYGSNYQRLREVKAAYDPANVFRFEQSVPIAAG